jgi:hypothetical protein
MLLALFTLLGLKFMLQFLKFAGTRVTTALGLFEGTVDSMPTLPMNSSVTTAGLGLSTLLTTRVRFCR